jgi:ABC-type transport system involved in cytochrome bd biosynthesis fused ATPase/permease subunit
VLAGGRIVETGGHKELLARQGAYATLYHLYEKLMPGVAARSFAVDSGR